MSPRLWVAGYMCLWHVGRLTHWLYPKLVG